MTTKDLAALRDMVLEELHPTTRYSIDGMIVPIGHTLDHQGPRSLLRSAQANKLQVRKDNMPAWIRPLIK